MRDAGRMIGGWLPFLLAAALLGTACSSSAESGEVVVSAAASLTDAFAELEEAFESSHPDLDVLVNLGGSSGLREQILAGAPADVFAPADLVNMAPVVEAGLARSQPVVFARNEMAIAVPSPNEAGVEGLDDFAREELLIGLCAPGVPCGELARQVLGSAGVVPAVDTEEPDVRALLTKLGTGELDAGIVYVTDVAAAGAPVRGIAIPEPFQAATAFTTGPNPDGAERFVDFVLSAQGQSILAGFGFEGP
jgi:molybdate transport system substrate-binding protein